MAAGLSLKSIENDIRPRLDRDAGFRVPDWAALNWSDVAADAARGRVC